MSKLTPQQIEEYFKIHLPYRNRILMAHKNLCDLGPYHGNPAILQSCFEASLITGRMYLNVLGISKKNNQIDRSNYRIDDLSAIDLGGQLVNLNTLSQMDKDHFLNFIIMADKGAAHLTIPRQHDLENTHLVIEKIVASITTHIYYPTGRQFTIA
jgi:hypothetical protein